MSAYLHVEDVAARCEVHPNTVYRWIQAGRLKARRMGKSYQILPEWLERIENARTTMTVAESPRTRRMR